MTDRHRTALLAVLAGAALASGAAAQEPPPPAFAERVEVEVVNVDVVVTDRDGNRVLGLGRDDFELLVDGKPVAIDYFAGPAADALAGAREPEAPLPATPPATAPEPETAPPVPSLLVVYVDQSALERRIRQTTIEELEHWVARRAPGERVMVAAFEDDLRLLTPPTTEPLEIANAFDRLADLPGRANLVLAERNRLEQEIRVSLDMATAAGTPGATGAEAGESEVLRLRGEIERWAEQELDRQLRSLRALQDVVAALAGIEGRKAAVLATGGYSPEPAAFLLRFLAEKRGLPAGGGQITRVARLDELSVRVGSSFERLVHSAQDARVAFHTVMPPTPPPASNDPQYRGAGAGLPTPPPRDFSSLDATSSAVRMAAATGGRAFVAGEDLAVKLASVRQDVAAAYSLGFSTGPAAGQGDHGIEVRVRQAGLQVRHRETFRRSSFPERARQALLAAASLGQTDNAAGILLEAGDPGRSRSNRDKGVMVPIVARIPIAQIALLPARGAHTGQLEVTFAVQTGDGQVVSGETASVPISVPAADLERALAGVWPHRSEVRLTPGRNRVAALVVDATAGTYATAVTEVDLSR